MHFARRIGAIVPHSVQLPRPTDGVRGLFSLQNYETGALLMKIPLAACCHAHSRSCVALPSFHWWLHTITAAHRDKLVQLSCTSSAETPSGVLEFRLEAYEAAVVMDLTFRYFATVFAPTSDSNPSASDLEALWGKSVRMLPLISGPSLRRNSLASMFFSSFPIHRIHSDGVESGFESLLVNDAAQDLHGCIEQVSKSLMDGFFELWATTDQERFLRIHEEDLTWILLSSIYATRSRVMNLPVLGELSSSRHRRKEIIVPQLAAIVPLLHSLNHNAVPNTAAVVSRGDNAVVLRAVRPIRVGDEMTMSYINQLQSDTCSDINLLDRHQRIVLHPDISVSEQMDMDKRLAWEARYQLGSNVMQ